jgi:hypothetical protein
MQRINPVFAILLGGLIIRLLALVLIVFFDPYVVLAGTDSLSFYDDSLYVSRTGDYFSFEIGWKPYVNFVAFLMYYFYDGISLLILLSIIAWMLTVILIDKALCLLNAKMTTRILAASVMAVQPWVALTSILPLREPFQMLGVAIIGFSLVTIAVRRNHRYWLLAAFGAVLSGILHMGMMLSSAVFVVIFLLGVNYAKGRLSLSTVSLGLIVGAVVTPLAIGFLESRYAGVSADLLGTIDAFREGSARLDARAQYKEVSDGAAAGGGLFGLISGFFQYMLMPFPWNISAAGDILVMLENLLRVILILLVLRNVTRSNRAERAIVLTLLAMFFATEFIWSVGTINWGTAARHHVPSTPLLLMACFALKGAAVINRHHHPRPSMPRRYGPRQLY